MYNYKSGSQFGSETAQYKTIASFSGLARSSLAVYEIREFCTASDKRARPGNEAF